MTLKFSGVHTMASNNDPLLPTGFDGLNQFVSDWAIADEPARMRKRWSSSMGEIRRFYDTMVRRVEEALDYLDSRKFEELQPPDLRLLYLTYALVEVANAVEVYHRPTSPYALGPDRYCPVERL